MTESTNEYKKRIEEIKQSIENEPYMAKMREDIAEGISKTGIRQATVEEQFQSVIDETTGKDVISAPEIILARGWATTLGERLDSNEADIANKMDKNTNNISVAQINKNFGKFDQTFMSDEFLQQIAGNAPINATPADKSVTTEKLASKSIKTKVLDDQLQKYIAKSLEWELGAIATNGAPSTTNTRIRTSFVLLKVGDTIKLEDSINYSFGYNQYDLTDKTHLYNSGYLDKDVVIDQDGYYRLFMRKLDDSNLTGIVDLVSENMIVYSKDSAINKANEAYSLIISQTKKDLYNGEFILDSITFNKTFKLPDSKETFFEIEFEAKSNGSGYLEISSDPSNRLNIDNPIYKPYKIRCYNHEKSGGFITFSALDTSVMHVKNVRLTTKSSLPKNNKTSIRFIAHRGVSKYAPENTAPSYALAKKFGMWGAEADVYQTLDGVWVLIHDSTIDRTSDGAGTISSLTYNQLLQYDFGSWKSQEYTGTPIMTLDEFMLFCKQSNLHPYVELKGEVNESNVDSLLEPIKKYGMMNNTTILSSLYQTLALVNNAANKKLRIAYSVPTINENYINLMKGLETEVIFNIGFSYHEITDPSPLIQLAHESGIEVEAWTVNSLEEYKKLVKCGVDGITTDLLNLEGCYF